MSSSEIVRQKRRGRPRSGQLPVISFRIDPTVQEEIDRFRSLEADKPPRSKAIRRLLIFGLSAANQELLPEIDRWRSSEADHPSRSSAIASLILMGLFSADREKEQGAGED